MQRPIRLYYVLTSPNQTISFYITVVLHAINMNNSFSFKFVNTFIA